MYKVASVILSFTILFQSFNFDLSDVDKIPTLVEHLTCHLEKGDSFSDFVSMHYGSTSEKHEEDHSGHKELPFKHQHVDTHFQIAFVIWSNNYPIESMDYTAKASKFTYKEPSTQLFTNNFFQPPKVA